MRTSTKILCITLAIMIACVVFYDTKLRAEYLKGDYKKPFWNYVQLNYSNFNSIQLNSSTAVNVFVTKGPFKVMIDPAATDFVKTRLEGKKLVIYGEFKDHYRSLNDTYAVFISCPDLSSLSTNAFYTAGNNMVTDTIALNFSWRPTIISGFTNDSLTVSESNASNVLITNCRINNFKAIIGISHNSGSDLTIGTGNFFNQTNIDIRNKSTLLLKNPAGGNINYHLADSAQLMVNGATQPSLKLKQP